MQKTMDKSSSGFSEGLNISRRDITFFVLQAIGFFIGRASVFGVLNPLGIAYLSVFLFSGWKFYISAVFVTLGLLTKLNVFYSYKYFICIMLLCTINFFGGFFKLEVKPIGRTIITAAVLLLSSAVSLLIEMEGLYPILLSGLEATLVFAIGFIFSIGVLCISNGQKRGSLNNEELISISLFAAGIVAGSADIYIWEISLRYFFCFLFVCIMARGGGSGIGAVSGLLLGAMVYLTGYEEISFAVILALGGMCAGLVRGRRVFPFLGFVVATGISAAFLNLKLLNLELLYSVILSGLAFCVLPDRFILSIYTAAAPASGMTLEYSDKVKSLAMERIKKLERAFSKMSATFGRIAEKKVNFTNKDIYTLVDDVADKVCKTCGKCEDCWNTNFYSTYGVVFSLLEKLEKDGEKAIVSSDGHLEFCISKEEFMEALSRYYELYKQKMGFQNRILESREIVASQLRGLSGILGNLANELDVILSFDRELENRILEELNKNKIEVESVIVLQNQEGKYEVTFGEKSSKYSKRRNDAMIEILDKILGRKMRKDEDEPYIENNAKKLNRVRYVEEQKLCVTSGVARGTKSGAKESGDSYSFMELKNGHCLMALSDGMGSGRRAQEESKAAIELLEEFIDSGFGRDAAVKLINSALLMKSGGDSFSTLDICSVDLQTGAAEFVKVGAAATFLIREGGVEIIRSWSLPAGIMDNIDIDASKRRLKHGDIIVMLSDGIIDSDENESDKEAWVIRAITELDSQNPQDIADCLLEKAGENYGECKKDDMTALVGRIWEKYRH